MPSYKAECEYNLKAAMSALMKMQTAYPREAALVRTKIEEAELWLTKVKEI